MSLYTASSQTVGPYVAIGFKPMEIRDIAPLGVAGERISVSGRVFDGDHKPITDGVVETWQADGEGRYHSTEGAAGANGSSAANRFRGFGRILTDGKDGSFRFTTIKPGRVASPAGGQQAPHIVVTVFMRGLLKHLQTRLYFPDDPANAQDLVLSQVPESRRGTLIARREADGGASYLWDIVVQGQDETVFFDY